ncbi:response regulator transcription factor [Ilumatobacter sp.]|uniref:response regulator transcription factor n=1 Tax=Ilumatobacter sp. TaxID=1967498 RepID=UPI003AF65E2D
MKVLVIEDDERTASALRRGLEAEHYTVEVANDGIDGLWLATETGADVIVLDIMLPGLNGYVVCRELRERGIRTPILMLTAKGGEWDEAEGLDTGADDYLVKPFSFTVLLARVRALLRRAGDVPSPLAVGDVRIDPGARRTWRGDVEIELTSRQFEVLEYLVRRAGRVQSKREILDGVWPHDFDGDPNIVEVYIRRLRRAIDEPFGRRSIETVRGAGYRIVDDGGPG